MKSLNILDECNIEVLIMWACIFSWCGECTSTLIDYTCNLKCFTEKYLKVFLNKYNNKTKLI